ncbi:MAG: hypothetical protein ACK45R_01905 [Candidatus Kapaibacterium sp.]|jgi:hypothetical protein
MSNLSTSNLSIAKTISSTARTAYRSGMVSAVVLCALVLLGTAWSSCAATKVIPPDAFVVSGKMNPVSGSKALKTDACWVMESGKDLRTLKYYQIIGSDELMNQLKEDDMQATIRVVPKPGVTTSCTVGTIVEVIEIIEARSIKN